MFNNNNISGDEQLRPVSNGINNPNEPLTNAAATPPLKKYSFLRELITFVLIAVFIVIPFRMYVAEPYIVSGTSMTPTFDTGHYLIVDKISYRFQAPKRLDVIVMIFPKDTTKDFIKRIIGLPGETVNIKNGKVTVVNTGHPEGLVLNDSFVKYPKNDTISATLKSNEYFVMGDNRAGSYDSRYWGPLPKSDIVGHPILRLWPISKIGFIPGKIRSNE